MRKLLVFALALILFQIFLVKPAKAVVMYNLSAPSPAPPLTRGSNVSFSLTVDTGGESVTSNTIGIRYATQYLNLVSVTPGTAFTSVTATTPANGEFTISVSKTDGFTGSGTIATLTFNIIADAPGSTQLCSTFIPTTTPTPGTTTTPVTPTTGVTCIPVPAGGTNSQYPMPQYCPAQPTSLPQTGNTSSAGIIGLVVLAAAIGAFFINKKYLHVFLILFSAFLYFFFLNKPVLAVEDYRNYSIDISPIPCAGVGVTKGAGCPNDFLNPSSTNWKSNHPTDKAENMCAESLEEFKTDPTKFHYWIEDPHVTEQGKADERARQFLYWVLHTTAIDNHPAIRQIWFLSSTIAYLFVLIVAAVFGIGFIVSRRTNLQINVALRPTLIKIGMMLLYIAFSYALLLFLIQMSEILMKFFIENLGGDKLFNIYFSGLTSSERNYIDFVGCRDLNIRVQEAANAELFLLKLTNVSYYVMGCMILLRKILLWFLIFVSPFLAILMPFIFIRNTGWIWIGVFFQWLFYGPLLALFLGATATIWGDRIPFSFDFSRVKQTAGYIYPTALIITYGGPAQVQAKSIGAFNNGNYVDTYAEYIISLLMLWAVTFFPWWLLRIFRDYCCEGIYATKNILMAMYDQMRNPPKSPHGGPSPALPNFKVDLKTPKDTDIKVNVKLSNLTNIKQIRSTDIAQSLNLNVSRLTDVARMEMNKTTQKQVQHNLALLSNPIKAQIPAERQQYMNLRTELFNRAVKNDAIARTILASTSTSRVEQTKQREEMLKQMPASVTMSKIISTQTNLTADKVTNITNSYVKSMTQNTTVIDQISKSTSLPASQVQQILNTYSQNISKPFTQIINTISKQTVTPVEKVKDVLKLTGSYSMQSSMLNDVATKEQLHKDHVEDILHTLSTITESEQPVVQTISQQTNLSTEKAQSIVNNIFNSVSNDSTTIQQMSGQTLVPAEQIRQVFTTYAQEVNNAPTQIVNKISQTTNLSKEKVTEVIQKTISSIQQSEVVKDIAVNNNLAVPAVMKVVQNLQSVIASPNSPPLEQTIIEKTSQLANLPAIQVQSIATSIVKNVVSNTELTQEIAQQSGVSPQQVNTMLQSYITHISQPSSTIINTIATENNVATNVVNNVLEQTHELIQHSASLRSIARHEQVKTKDVNTVTNVLFTESQVETKPDTATAQEEQKQPVVKLISYRSHIPEAKVQAVTSSVMNSLVNSPTLIQNIEKETGLNGPQVQNLLTTYAQNVNESSEVINQRINQSSGIQKEKVQEVLKIVTNNISTSKDILTDVARKEGIKEEDVAHVINDQIPLATSPEQHIEKTIAIPANVSIEDYEEVKNMWIKQYEEGEVPVTENLKSRDEWLDQDIVFITNTLNKLLSSDDKLRQEGLDELGYILPIFMINNLKGDELLVYLKAKLEAAKSVQKSLDKERRLKAQVIEEKENDEELVELKKPRAEEAPKAMELEEEEPEEEKPAAADESDTTPSDKAPSEVQQDDETQDKTEEAPATDDTKPSSEEPDPLLDEIKKKLEKKSE